MNVGTSSSSAAAAGPGGALLVGSSSSSTTITTTTSSRGRCSRPQVGIVAVVVFLVTSLFVYGELCDVRMAPGVTFLDMCGAGAAGKRPQQHQQGPVEEKPVLLVDGLELGGLSPDYAVQLQAQRRRQQGGQEQFAVAYTPVVRDLWNDTDCGGGSGRGGLPESVQICGATFPTSSFQWRSFPRKEITGGMTGEPALARLCGEPNCEWIPPRSKTAASDETCGFLCTLPSYGKPQLRFQSAILHRRDVYVPRYLATDQIRNNSCFARELGLIHPQQCLNRHGAAAASPCSGATGWTPAAILASSAAASGGAGGSASASLAPDPRPLSILAIGHSHTRFLAGMLCMMLLSPDCAVLEDQFRITAFIQNATTATATGGKASGGRGTAPPALTFVQANYQFGHKIARVQQEWAGNFSAAAGTMSDAITHVLISKGSWDLLFNDRSPLDTVSELEDGLMELLSTFPRAHFILYMPHYVHIKAVPKPSPKALSSPKMVGKQLVHNYNRMVWRKKCFSERRLRMMRDVNLCSGYRASVRWWNETQQQRRQPVAGGGSDASARSSNISAAQVPFFLYDIWPETRTAFGAEFVDVLGHHYQDLFLESVSAQLVGAHVCPAGSAEGTFGCPARLCLRDGHAACSRLEALSAYYVPEPECACHNMAVRNPAQCKKYGRGVPDISARN